MPLGKGVRIITVWELMEIIRNAWWENVCIFYDWLLGRYLMRILLQGELNKLAIELLSRMRSLIPTQQEIIEQQLEPDNKAVALFDGVVEETQQDCICNILMGFESRQIPFSFEACSVNITVFLRTWIFSFNWSEIGWWWLFHPWFSSSGYTTGATWMNPECSVRYQVHHQSEDTTDEKIVKIASESVLLLVTICLLAGLESQVGHRIPSGSSITGWKNR